MLGAAVYNIGYTGGYGCPGAWAGLRRLRYAVPERHRPISGQRRLGLVRPAGAGHVRRPGTGDRPDEAECAALGGHGVVGVELTIGAFPAGGLEFKAIGTAVRGPGRAAAAAAVHLGPVRPGLRQADHRRLGAGRPGARHLGRRPARRLADRRARPRGARATPRSPATPSWSTRPGTTPGPSWSGTCRGMGGRGRGRSPTWTCGSGERECPMQEGRRDHIVEATIIGTAIARVHGGPGAAGLQPPGDHVAGPAAPPGRPGRGPCGPDSGRPRNRMTDQESMPTETARTRRGRASRRTPCGAWPS